VEEVHIIVASAGLQAAAAADGDAPAVFAQVLVHSSTELETEAAKHAGDAHAGRQVQKNSTDGAWSESLPGQLNV
jgi:hypothetical protein